jgi:hypothetical protein
LGSITNRAKNNHRQRNSLFIEEGYSNPLIAKAMPATANSHSAWAKITTRRDQANRANLPGVPSFDLVVLSEYSMFTFYPFINDEDQNADFAL